jgi:hypothetical protein
LLNPSGLLVRYKVGLKDFYDWFVNSQTVVVLPLEGLPEQPNGRVQDKLQPGWTNDGFPSERLAGKWSNLFHRPDPVCALDPLLANDYRSAGDSRVEDIAVQNDGSWRHSATK